MPEISKPTESKWWIARNGDGSVLHQGINEPNQVTTTGQPMLDSSDSESEQLQKLTSYIGSFPKVPEVGEELTEGEIYSIDGQLVQVRQSHKRTDNPPRDVPALWLWYRADKSLTEWVSGEKVITGTIRSFKLIDYKCIQSHVTQSDWTPPQVPALWSEIVVTPPGPQAWAAGTYAIDVLVTHVSRTWRSLMNANTREPGLVGTWRDQSVPPMWVQSAGAVGVWQVDDEATHLGQTWRNTSANNSFAPGVFGWVVI